MIYKSLYRTYRPQQFSEVVGQKHIVTALSNALKRNKIAHAYLFCGPRGIGKTTVAKLFAKAVNCLQPDQAPCGECASCVSMNQPNHPDIIEMDAASNNGVDEIREIVDKVKYAPVEGKYKIYIIDEVHMLTSGAFNALLKTLEEPPRHVIFILATTDPQKVIPTVISRTQRFDFTRASVKDISELIEKVAEEEKIQIDPEAIKLIAELADGGFRDGLSILEQVIAFADEEISVEVVSEVYRLAKAEDLQYFIEDILNLDVKEAYRRLELFDQMSIDYRRFTHDLMELCKASVILKLTKDSTFVAGRFQEAAETLSMHSESHRLLDFIDEFLNVQNNARFSGLYRSYLEVATLKLCQVEEQKVVEPVTERPTVTKVAMDKSEKSPVLPVQPKPQKKTRVEPKVEIKAPNPTNSQKVEEDIISVLIDLMVLGKKELREQESERWYKVNDLALDPEYRKVAIILKNSDIKISGEEFVVVSLARQEQVNVLNQPSNQQLIRETMKAAIGTEKSVLAVSNQELSKAVTIFMDKMNSKTLPTIEEAQKQLVRFEVKEPEEIEIIDPEALLKEMLGDLVVVKDE
ncbi:MAG TPA: DNA polymerase III subunit gamma/tau [Erysipelothrix sp.]|nr:DNA polymerase III subunit gamma/tau [Erysipelothrix sp.]